MNAARLFLALLLVCLIKASLEQYYRPERKPLLVAPEIFEENELEVTHPPKVKENNRNEVVVLLLVSNQTELPVFFEVLKPSVELALEDIRLKYPHLKFTLKAKKDPNSCEQNVMGALAAEEFYLSRVDAMIGPICTRGLNAVARLASYWGIPIITAGGIGAEFSDKRIFKALTRISFSLDRVADFFSKIIQDYEWHHLSFIIDEGDPKSNLIRYSFEKSLRSIFNYEVNIDIQSFTKINNDHDAMFKKLLLQSKKAARVFFFIMGGELSRNFLIHAYDLGMNNGEYTFFGLELVKTSEENFGWYRQGDRNNKKAKIMFESFMTLAIRVPVSPEYNSFVNKVYRKAIAEFDTANELNVNPLVAAFYDALTIYAWAYNRSLTINDNTTQAQRINRFLWGNMFQDGLTGDIIINENGDREMDYTLSDFNPETGVMQSVLTYYGKRRVVERNEGVKIHWPGNMGSPLDVPYCGFNDNAIHCLHHENFPLWAILLMVITVITVSIASLSIFLLKRIRSEQDLNSDWWHIRPNEIELLNERVGKKSSMSMATTNTDDGGKSGKASSLRSTTQLSGGYSLMSSFGKFDSILVGTFKGIKIAYKPIEVKRLTTTRKILVEFRQMRDLTHENLVRFYGICMDEQNIGLVTELMIRGSLRDVLDADKMQIDWNFRYSMISDIIEGMIYLHGSNLEYHGRLKSTNCVIDGRFMVKLTDYGLRALHKQITREKELNPRSLYWTAPEHIRSSDPVNSGSKKGDIYSFGIILQEIITRCGPFESSRKGEKVYYEPKEVLDRLRMGSNPPFRPVVDVEDCPRNLIKMMELCWSEDFDRRPDFTKLKPAFKKISQGLTSSNFLDNLLQRMEQYSQNLEAIVEEKTQTMIEEKMKTDELLYQILPQYVADELKAGRHVKPEMYESVTIFFSDIVGFTTLSAQSNPLQVVNLLNELYTCFDSIINAYDAYKMETIGDAYMVASGVPIRNGNLHAKEVALLALNMRSAVEKYKIRHLPHAKLQLRIGIHSGPVAAGVVGNKMPKYLVFGNTVNIASQLESLGEPRKIHVSENTKQLLDKFGTFQTSKHDEVDIKGKGKLMTHWLMSSTDASYQAKEFIQPHHK